MIGFESEKKEDSETYIWQLTNKTKIEVEYKDGVGSIKATYDDDHGRLEYENKYLLADGLDILKDAGKISHKIAIDKVLSEFEKYRITQDKLFESDFDKFIKGLIYD